MIAELTVSLADQAHELARGLVAGGKFASLSAVVQHGFRLVECEEVEHRARLDAIRADLDRRAGQTSITAEEMDARLATWRAERDAARRAIWRERIAALPRRGEAGGLAGLRRDRAARRDMDLGPCPGGPHGRRGPGPREGLERGAAPRHPARRPAPGLGVVPFRKRTAIAFEVDDARGMVTILRVFYGGQDYEAILGPGRG
jgi:antitoxin ParD1/3/4